MKFLFNAALTSIAYLIWTENRCVAQITFLDKYRPTYRFLRSSVFDFVGRTDTQWAYKWNLDRGVSFVFFFAHAETIEIYNKKLSNLQKVQKPFPSHQEFFCDPKGPGRRSATPPVSVHKLRPGDIDVVGAIGDSLTAGNGALATNILQVIIENKGVSWSIGGQGTWHKFLTLPNILKVFNPNVYGYSLSDGYSVQKVARSVLFLFFFSFM